MTYHHKNTYDITITSLFDYAHDHDNFIDCGITDIIKSEEEDDLPLSELHLGELDEEIQSQGVILHENEHKKNKKLCKNFKLHSNKDTNEKRFISIKESIKKTSKKNGFKLSNLNNLIDNNIKNCKEIEETNKRKVKKLASNKKKTKMKQNKLKKYYNTKIMSAMEMQDVRERKKKDIYLNTMLKCESCVEMFKSLDELETHNTDVHSEVCINSL